MRLFRSVWGQFVIIGVGLFLLDRNFFPEPKPIIGPPNVERVALQAQALSQLQGAELNESQVVAIKERELRDELLFIEALDRGFIEQDQVIQRRLIRNMRFMDPERDIDEKTMLIEAFELRLHLADEVIRRRTIQVMETLIVASRGDPAITEADLKVEYEAQQENFQVPVRYSFTHVFLRDDASDEKRENLLALLSDGASPEHARGFGDVFLAGYQFKQRSLLEISRQFGDDFAYGFASQAESLGEWVGPIQSIFGSHWVWVDDIAESRVKSFTEVAQDLRRDIRRDLDDRAIQDWVDSTLQKYEVRL